MFMFKQDLHSQYKSFHSVSLQKHAEERKTKTLLRITQKWFSVVCSTQATSLGFEIAYLLYSNILYGISRLKFSNRRMSWAMSQFPYHLWHRYGSRGQVCVAPGCRPIHGFRLPVGTSRRFFLQMSPMNFRPKKKYIHTSDCYRCTHCNNDC